MEDGRQRQMLALLLVALLVGGFIKMFFAGNSEPVVIERPDTAAQLQNEAGTADQSGKVAVFVTGAVAEPGVYYLPVQARVEDAIDMAKPRSTADLSGLALARRVVDGETIKVPRIGDSAADLSEQSDQSIAGGKININTATEQQLDSLPGIGPAYAQRIIDYRRQNGGFKALDELKNVSGIGEKRFEQLKDAITF